MRVSAQYWQDYRSMKMLGQPNTTKENPQRRKKARLVNTYCNGSVHNAEIVAKLWTEVFWKWSPRTGEGVEMEGIKARSWDCIKLVPMKVSRVHFCSGAWKIQKWVSESSVLVEKKDGYSLPPKLRHETVYCLQVFTSICTLCGFCQYSNNCKTPQQSIKDIQSIQFNMQSSLQHMRSKDGQKGSDPEQVSS